MSCWRTTRSPPSSRLLGSLDKPFGTRADAALATRSGSRHRQALAAQGGVGQSPAVVDFAQHVAVVYPGPVDEGLGELLLAADGAQRAHVDAGLAHVQQEVGDAGPLLGVRVGAGQADGVVGDHCLGGPHFLAGQHPLFAVAHRPGSQRGQIGAGIGLAEELAPDLLGGDDGRDERAFCSSVPKVKMVGPARVRPSWLRRTRL